MNIIIKNTLQNFAVSSKTHWFITFHLILLSFILLVCFSNQYQKFSFAFENLTFSNAETKTSSYTLSQIGNSLIQRMFELFVRMEMICLFFFIPPLFWNCFRRQAYQRTFEWMCASPLSLKEILKATQCGNLLCLFYFLISTIPFYFACFTFGLPFSSQVLGSLCSVLSFSFFSLQYGLHFAMSYQGTKEERFRFYQHFSGLCLFFVIIGKLFQFFVFQTNWEFVVLYCFAGVFYWNRQKNSYERLRLWLI